MILAAETLGIAGGVVFREEHFSSLRYEGAALFHEHWLEASADLSIPLDVDWETFYRLEVAGLSVCVTARNLGQLIGYAVYIMHPALHYRSVMTAEADAFYIDPEFRRGWVGVRLFQCAEIALRRAGVEVVQTRVKVHVKNGRVASLLRFLGHKRVECIWRKRLD